MNSSIDDTTDGWHKIESGLNDRNALPVMTPLWASCLVATDHSRKQNIIKQQRNESAETRKLEFLIGRHELRY